MLSMASPRQIHQVTFDFWSLQVGSRQKLFWVGEQETSKGAIYYGCHNILGRCYYIWLCLNVFVIDMEELSIFFLSALNYPHGRYCRLQMLMKNITNRITGREVYFSWTIIPSPNFFFYWNKETQTLSSHHFPTPNSCSLKNHEFQLKILILAIYTNLTDS